ncbi:MAG TPA: group III truncated hemoglobin [Chryseosolibacter sp.]|nr:group III truncated hemoglobin [Chryseosolibacter sp.]
MRRIQLLNAEFHIFAAMNVDIKTRDDITKLITRFYEKVRVDEQLAPHFVGIDWDHHTPIIIDFWAMLLLGDSNYKGNPLAKHLRLSLKVDDFKQWLFHFHNTVDEFYSGDIANEAKQRAQNIAAMFQYKLGIQ